MFRHVPTQQSDGLSPGSSIEMHHWPPAPWSRSLPTPVSARAPAVPVHPTGDVIVGDEIAKDGVPCRYLVLRGTRDLLKTDFEDPEDEGALALGEGAGAGGLGDLLFFEAAGCLVRW